MGKRGRNTAKTGDKALYRNRNNTLIDAKNNQRKTIEEERNDHVYSAVDRFHNQREKDFLMLDGSNNDDDENDINNIDTVMDLAAEVDEDDDESDDDDSDDDDENDDNANKRSLTDDDESRSSDEDEEVSIASSNEDNLDDDDEKNNIRSWGTKKSSYYDGDIIDDTEGDDAELEEIAAKEVQASRLKEMSEDDFIVSDDDDDDDVDSDKDTESKKSKNISTTSRKVSKIVSNDKITALSVKEKRKIIEKQHPEMLPILSHFTDIVQNLQNHTSIANKAIFDSAEENTAETVGTTKLGQQYLLTKTMLQSSAALNLAMYLLLKLHYQRQHNMNDDINNNDDDDARIDPTELIQSHPVMTRLQKIHTMLQNIGENVEQNVDGLKEQMDNLVKAAEFMMSTSTTTTDNNLDDSSENDSVDNTDIESEDNESVEDNDNVRTMRSLRQGTTGKDLPASDDEDDNDDVDEIDEIALANSKRRSVQSEARFGLRQSELERNSKTLKQQRTNRLMGALEGFDDDEADGNNNHDVSRRKNAMQSLARTVNTIEQRAATSKRKSSGQMAEQVDYKDNDEDGDGELRRGLEMMEAELGKFSDEEDGGNSKGASDGGKKKNNKKNDDEDDYYDQATKQSKGKRAARQLLYQVAPKFPSMDVEIDGERPINRTILKNRGLVAHKAKINRNPRVKKREQYRKKLISRKGTIREVRTNEMHQYGGEETGIKRNLVRSRQLG